MLRHAKVPYGAAKGRPGGTGPAFEHTICLSAERAQRLRRSRRALRFLLPTLRRRRGLGICGLLSSGMGRRIGGAGGCWISGPSAVVRQPKWLGQERQRPRNTRGRFGLGRGEQHSPSNPDRPPMPTERLTLPIATRTMLLLPPAKHAGARSADRNRRLSSTAERCFRKA